MISISFMILKATLSSRSMDMINICALSPSPAALSRIKALTFLISLNQKYAPIPVHLDRDDFRIFGKVCRATR